MAILDLGAVRTSRSYSGELVTFWLGQVQLHYHYTANEGRQGNNTLIFTDEEGVRYVASINVRAEFSEEFANPFFMTQETKDRQNRINENLD